MQQETLRSVNVAFAMPLLGLCLCFTGLAANAAEHIPNTLGAFNSLQLASSTSFGSLTGSLLPDDCEEEDYVTMLTRPASPSPDTAAGKLDQDGIMLAAAQKPNRSRPGASTKTDAEKPAAEVPPPAPPAPVWEIAPSDGTLNGVFARWTAQAGWQLSWELPVDYAVEARTAIPGTFEQAVETVAKSMDTAEIPLKAIFYKGNKVLRIVAKGVEQ